MKILVTGANGFVGSKLVNKFVTEERQIVGAFRELPIFYNENCGFEYVLVGNIDPNTDWKHALCGVQTVIHVAARVHVMNETEKDPITAFRHVNVAGTLNLARQAAVAGVHRFIFLSSIKVNGESTDIGQPFTADDEPAPLDPYGISKMEAEQGLRKLSFQTGMEVTIIRPSLVYGPGVKANFASMIRWLRQGVPLPLGSITKNRRSFVYVENLIDLISICVDHPNAANHTFLISDDEDVSTTTLLRRMARALRCPARLVWISPTLIKLSAKLIGKPKIADRLCGSLQVDISKTKELLGWKPKFTLEEGLLRTAKSLEVTSDI